MAIVMSETYFTGKTVEVIHKYHTTHPFESFAFDDFLQHQVSEDNTPKIRFWQHSPFIILGLQDARLPMLNYGLDFLNDAGFEFIVRNSGGLGVVLDDGVLNISLVLPKADFQYIEDGYDMMVELVQTMFKAQGIEAYEIHDSYCPGTYDLSIDGKKFAGISQRRIKDGVAVQIYLSVTGSGSERAKLMKDFYKYARAVESEKFTYPLINPEHMASLNELLKTNFSVQEVEALTLKALEKMGANIVDFRELSETDKTVYERFKDNIKNRNSKYMNAN